MGYGDGALELGKAHRTLSDLYLRRGGKEMNAKIKERRAIQSSG